MSNAAQGINIQANPRIALQQVGEVEIAPIIAREPNCLTGLAQWICSWEDAGGFWKVASYALRFFALLGSMITMIGVPLFIWADREIVRVDFENDLRRRDMLTAPGALIAANQQIVHVRGERDAHAQTIEGLQADVQRLAPLAEGVGQTDERIKSLTADLVRERTALMQAREELSALKEQQQKLGGKSVEQLETENQTLRAEVTKLRAAVVDTAAANDEYLPLVAKLFGNKTPARAPVQGLVDALPEKHRRVLDDVMIGRRSTPVKAAAPARDEHKQ